MEGFTPIPKLQVEDLGTENTGDRIALFDADGRLVGYVMKSSIGGIPNLEFNETDKTVWNNGKGNKSSNTSFGEFALKSNTSGEYNNSYGTESLSLNTSGKQNTAYGSNSLRNNIEGSFNTSVGGNSLTNASGSQNSALGFLSISEINGDNNLSIGSYSGYGFGTGPNSVLSICNNSVFLGMKSRPLLNDCTNEIAIGYDTIGNGSNTATIGNDSIEKTILKGVVNSAKSFTVSTLPTGFLGDSAIVTDAITPTYLGTLTGGGAVKCPVWHNGTNWVSR